jgi:hypothetical protein
MWVASSVGSASRPMAAPSSPRRSKSMPKRSAAATSRWVPLRIRSASCQLQNSAPAKSSSEMPGANGRRA